MGEQDQNVTNATTGVRFSGGPDTDLSTTDFPPGTTSVENGVPSNIKGQTLAGAPEKQKPPFDPNMLIPPPVTQAAPQVPQKPKFDPNMLIPPSAPMVAHQEAWKQAGPNKQVAPTPLEKTPTFQPYVPGFGVVDTGLHFDPFSKDDWKKAIFGGTDVDLHRGKVDITQPPTTLGGAAAQQVQRQVDATEDIKHGHVIRGLGKLVDEASFAPGVSYTGLAKTVSGMAVDTAAKVGKTVDILKDYATDHGVYDIVHGDVSKGLTELGNTFVQHNPEIVDFAVDTAKGIDAIKNGNVVGGAKQIIGARLGLMRGAIIPESPLERQIQAYNPTFKGTAPDGRRLVDPTTVRGTALPPADVAQFVSMEEHPGEKAIAESAQGFLSPEMVGLIVSGGGSALLKDSKAITTLNRLVAAGFSAQAIAGGIEHSQAAYDAVKNGDANLAVYHIFHAGISGAMAVPGMYGAAGEHMDFMSPTDIAVANKAVDTGTKVVEAGMGATGAAADAARDLGKGVKKLVTLGAAQTIPEAIRRVAEPSKGVAAEYIKKLNRSENDLTAILNTDKNASASPQGLVDALQKHIDGIVDELLTRSKATMDETKPVVPNIEGRVRESMEAYAKEHRGELGSDEEVESAMQDIMKQILRTEGEGETQTSRAINLHEAEGVRRKLNKDGQSIFAPGAKPTTDAYKVLSQHVAEDVLRPAIDERFSSEGVEGVAKARDRMADLIDIKKQVVKGQGVFEKMGQPGVMSTIMKKMGTPGFIVALMTGVAFPHFGIPGLVAAVLGDRVAQNITHPLVNLERAQTLAAKNPNAKAITIDTTRADQGGPQPPPGAPPGTIPEPTGFNPPTPPANPSAPAPVPPTPPVRPTPEPPPTNHALHAELASYYNLPMDSSAPEASLEALKRRFYENGDDIAAGRVTPTPEQATARAAMLKIVNKAVAEDRQYQFDQQRKTNDKHSKDVQKYNDDFQKYTVELQKYADGQQAAKEKAEAKEAEKAQPVGETKAEEGVPPVTELVKGAKTPGEAKAAEEDKLKTEEAGEAEEEPVEGEEKLTMEQRVSRQPHSQFKQNYAFEVTHPDGSTTNENVLAHASKDAFKLVQKKFPDASNFELGQVTDVPTEQKGYTVPTEKPLPTKAVLRGWADRYPQIKTMLHELGHFMVGHSLGQKVSAMLRHTAPGMGPLNNAALEWNIYPKDIREMVAEPGHERLLGLVQSTLGGIAADEAFSGEHRSVNPQMERGDGKAARKLLELGGYSPEDSTRIINELIDAGIKHLTHPDVSAIMQENAGVREPGLSPQYHFSGRRLNAMGEEAARRINERAKTNNGEGARTGNRGNEEAVAGRKGQVPTGSRPAPVEAKAAEGTRAAEEITPEEHQHLLDRWLEEKSGYHPDLQSVIKQTRSLSREPLDIKHTGTLITPDGQFSVMRPGQQHPDLIQTANPERAKSEGDNRPSFLNETGAIRTRYTEGRGGPTLAVSVPERGATPQQIEAIGKATTAALGRNGNLIIETAGGEGAAPRSTMKEFAKISDIVPMLQKIGALPEGHLKQEMTLEPMAAMKESREAEAAANKATTEQLAAHEKNGGSTFTTPEGENLAGKDLYAVGAYPRRTEVVDKLTPEILADFKAKNADVLSQGDHTVGTWKDPDTGKVVLDISKTYGNRDEAVAAGKAANQKAIYHLGGEGEIQIGGTGEVLPTPAEAAPNRKAALRAEENLGPEEAPEEGPRTINYVRNPQAAPSFGERFGQHLEPAGRYLNEATEGIKAPKGWETGSITFNKPLVVDFGGGYQDPSNWKNVLSKAFGDKTGQELSDAIRAKGYDGIITKDENGDTSEIVDLTKRQPEDEGFAFGKNVEGTPDQQKGLISTRVPTAVKATENPLTTDLQVGREAIHSVPGLDEKMADLVREYPGVNIPKNIKDPVKVLDRFTNHVKENLKTLYNQVSPERREANMKWYDSANKLASKLADKYGKSTKQLAGVIASMSPQKDWDMNVGLAERVNDIYHQHQDTVATPEMIAKGNEIGNRPTGKVFAELTPKLEGKRLSDLTDMDEKAAFVRLYDEAHNPRAFQSIDPATGEGRGAVKTGAGEPKRIGWGSLNEIGKALSILEDGSRENIHNNLGDAHKVRNFYNNILDPNNSAGHVTIDTHAVAAGLMRMLSGNSSEVLHNFGAGGGPSSAVNGVNGTYALYADAYRQAAAELGVQPRQLQSVVWEEIRNQFPAEMKRIPKYVDAVNDIWKQYGDRKITLDKAHELVRQYAQDASKEMAEKQKPGKMSANDLLEALGQGGLFALRGGK